MTAMKQATSEAVTEWTKIFPKQATENYTSSVMFMKQLTVVAVSTITYLKGAFPEDNFMVESFGGMRIFSLKDKCRDELAQFISTALQQAFDAFDKKYLHQLALCFYDGDCKLDNLFEYYIFEYSFKESGVTMSFRSKSTEKRAEVSCTMESVRAQTSNLLRACFVSLQSLAAPLPEVCDVSLRLYYNDDTPEEYQAPGYSSAADATDPLGSTSEDSFKLGSVDTPYHRLSLRTYVKDSLRASHEAIPSQNPPTMTQAEDDILTARARASGRALQCVCNNYDHPDLGFDTLLTCTNCGTVQHASCYGVSGAVTSHCCVRCGDRSDPRLVNASAKKRETIAIFRRALAWCSAVSEVSGAELVSVLGISSVSALKLLKTLRNEGMVTQPYPNADMTVPETINADKLRSLKAAYFQSDEIVDRLVVESFSQDSQPDPLSQSLSQEEQASLHSTSQIGRIISPEVNNNVEDSTLKQYREALIRVERMDVNSPLSGDPIKDMENLEKKATKRKIDKDDMIVTGVKTKRTVRRK